jgi:hypothetical protein
MVPMKILRTTRLKTDSINTKIEGQRTTTMLRSTRTGSEPNSASGSSTSHDRGICASRPLRFRLRAVLSCCVCCCHAARQSCSIGMANFPKTKALITLEFSDIRRPCSPSLGYVTVTAADGLPKQQLFLIHGPVRAANAGLFAIAADSRPCRTQTGSEGLSRDYPRLGDVTTATGVSSSEQFWNARH